MIVPKVLCGHDAYEKRVGEGGMLNAKKETLIGFSEPLLDKKLERKVVYLHLTINFLYYGIPK